MKKIIEFLKETDKQLHILACFVIAAIAAVVFRTFGNIVIDSVCFGWLTAFAVGAGKEIYDEWETNTGDVRDWIADIIGYTLGCLYALWALSLT